MSVNDSIQVHFTRTAPVFDAKGVHLLLTLTGCDPDWLDDESKLKQLAGEAATATGATVLQLVSHKFEPQGVTALALLAESHASLHSYPESGLVFWDCFTCGDECKPELSVNYLVDALKPKKISQQLVQRE